MCCRTKGNANAFGEIVHKASFSSTKPDEGSYILRPQLQILSGSVRVRFAEPSANADFVMSSCRVSDAPTNAVSSNSRAAVEIGFKSMISNGISGVRSLRVDKEGRSEWPMTRTWRGVLGTMLEDISRRTRAGGVRSGLVGRWCMML